MEDFKSYQDSLGAYQDTSGRTETEESLEQYLKQNPIQEEPSEYPIKITPQPDGTVEEEVVETTPQEAPASQQIAESKEEQQNFQTEIITEAQDWIAEKFLGQSREDREAKRQGAREKFEQINTEIDRADETNTLGYTDEESGEYVPVAATTPSGILRDSVRAVTSGVDKAVQSGIGFANYAGDFAKTRLGLVDEDDEWNNVDHAHYRGSERDLVMAEPRSVAGEFARDMVQFVTMANKVKQVTGLGAAASSSSNLVQRAGIESVVGAVTDFIADPSDGNTADALIQFFPSLKDNDFLAVFATAEDDDEFTRRAKNAVSGAVMEVAVDATGTALSGLFKAAKVLLPWKAANPGLKASEAPKELKEMAAQAVFDQLELDLPRDVTSTKPPKTLEAREVFTEMSDGDFSRADQLNAVELKSLVEDYQLPMMASERDLLRAADPEVSMEALGKAVIERKLPNGSTVDWILTEVGVDDAPGNSVMRIDWDLGGEKTPADIDLSDAKVRDFAKESWDSGNPSVQWDDLRPENQDAYINSMRQDGDFGFKDAKTLGTHGTKLYRQIGTIARDLKPGTIVQAEAAEDGFGAKGISSAQERRASITTRNKAAKAWIKENNDALKEQYLKDIAQTEPEYWDNLDMQAKWDHFEGRGIEGVVPEFVDPKKNELSIRQKLYMRSGLSAPNEKGLMFGIVKYRPQGRKVFQPLDSTRPIQEQVDEAIESARQYELDIDWDSAEVRPGKFDRYVEDYENGGNRFRQDYEPYERAGQTAEFPIRQVIDEQEYARSAPRGSGGAPNPRLTDNTIRQIAEADGDIDVIQRAVRELEDELTPALRAKDPQVLKQAREQIAKWYLDNTGEQVNMSALTQMVDDDGLPSAFIRTVLGNKVAKTLMRDISYQLKTLSEQARQITETGADANRQYNLMFDRLKALAVLQIKDGSRRGVGLQALQVGFGGNSEQAVAKRIANFSEKIEDLRAKVNDGDPEAIQDVKVFADSLTLAEGDPDLALNFTEKFFKYGRENFETIMYNSYLSAIVTQERSILGSAINVALKPLQMAMGSLMEPEKARSALSMYVGITDSIAEGWSVAKAALKNQTQDSISQTESAFTRSDMDTKISTLRALAKTKYDHAAVTLLEAQSNFVRQPWLQAPTRLLDAGDRMFRTISARQKVKYDMMMLAFEDGVKFDPKKYEISLSTKFKDGEIVDEELLKWSKMDTFQEDLGRTMSTISGMINKAPFLKYVLPFVKTPTNIIKQTGHYVPLLGRMIYKTDLGNTFFKEYSEVMRGSDEALKAVYKGREATGIMLGITFTSLGFQGIATGSGPMDPQLREIWEQNNRPHSINIGGKWVSNRFLGPLGILMSAYADIGLMTANRGTYDNASDLFGQLVYVTAGSLLDQSWMRALAETMEGVVDVAYGKKSPLEDADEVVAGLMRAMTPWQAALRSWNNTLTPGLRQYNNGYERYAAETIPFAKRFLGAERISPFTGEPVANKGLSALNQLLPFNLAEVRDDEVVQYLIDYGIDVPMEFQDKYKGVELSAYDSNELNKLIAKQGLREDLKDYFESNYFKEEYIAWKNDDKKLPRKKAPWYTNARAFFADHRAEAMQTYRNMGTPEAQKFDQLINQIDERDYYIRKGNYEAARPAQRLINNP